MLVKSSMVKQTTFMDKQSRKGAKPKRVRTGRMLVEIRKPFADVIAAIGKEEVKDPTALVNDLIREALIARRRWVVGPVA